MFFRWCQPFVFLVSMTLFIIGGRNDWFHDVYDVSVVSESDTSIEIELIELDGERIVLKKSNLSDSELFKIKNDNKYGMLTAKILPVMIPLVCSMFLILFFVTAYESEWSTSREGLAYGRIYLAYNLLRFCGYDVDVPTEEFMLENTTNNIRVIARNLLEVNKKNDKS